ncbi:MAG: hypothetical protein ACRD3T_16945, partial [Terriglobia bacterium]
SSTEPASDAWIPACAGMTAPLVAAQRVAQRYNSTTRSVPRSLIFVGRKRNSESSLRVRRAEP